MKVVVSSSAQEDMLTASRYYLEQSPDLPDAFLGELNDAFQLIAENPDIGSPIGDGNRKVVLQRFPFLVIYRREKTTCIVLAVGHQRRRPNYWKST